MSRRDDATPGPVDDHAPGRDPARRPDADPAPWLAWPLGAKVMVRRRLTDGGYSDLVGLLLERDADHLLVRGRRGDVSVPAAEVAIGRLVPPPVLGPRRPDGTRPQ